MLSAITSGSLGSISAAALDEEASFACSARCKSKDVINPLGERESLTNALRPTLS